MDDLITTRQLMDLLQLDRTTIYRMLNDGRLPALRVGGQWRFSRQAIEGIIQGNKAPTHADEKVAPTALPNTDVLPLHCLQPIQEVFAQTAGIGSVTTDLDGKALTSCSNACPFCSLILATDKGAALCEASWRRLADPKDRAPHLENCHAGLSYARGWIKLNDEPVAMIFGGQFLVGVHGSFDSHEHIARVAANCGIEQETLRRAAREIHALAKERAEQLLHLLQLVADTFSTIGQERLDMMSRLKKVAELADMAQH